MISAALFSWEDRLAPSVVSGDVLALQRGDRDALVALLSRYKNRLYRYLLRLVREPAAAEDLFQQTWLRVIEQIRRYDGRRSFEAWLFTVARNLAFDHLRRYRPESLEEPSVENLPGAEQLAAGSPDALDNVIRFERAELVQRALGALPAISREILTLRFEEEMKLEEIARVLAIPLSTVKSRLGRALERLRAASLRLRLEGLGS
jgi:RNA polymerase sigma-70 factor, ECF subfamily